LQLYGEFNDRYNQAGTYHQLGSLAQQQGQWEYARKFFFPALELFVAVKDDYSSGIVLHNLAQLWRNSSDTNLLAAIAPILGKSLEETEALLRKMLEDE
jgi:hypothetical protein